MHTETTGAGLYCGMTDDIISPFVLIPNLSTIVAIDYFDSAFALDGTWDGQKEDILKSLTDGYNNVTLEDIDSPINPSQLAKKFPAVLEDLHVEIVTEQVSSGLWAK